jgi:Zn-dependent M28 family amino/carboxypeptidase
VLAAGINLDTLNLAGPSRDLVLLGSELSTLGPVARRIAARFGRVVRPDPDPSRGAFLRGDHLALAEAGIPAVGVGSPAWFLSADQAASRRAHEEWTGVRYHQPNDEVSAAFDYAGAVPDLRVLASLGWALASAPERPAYRRGLPLSPFVAQAPSLP